MYAIKVKFEAPVSILNFLKWCTEVHPWNHHFVIGWFPSFTIMYYVGVVSTHHPKGVPSPDFQGSRNHWDGQMLPGEVGARSADPKICDGTTYSHAIYHLYLVTWSRSTWVGGRRRTVCGWWERIFLLFLSMVFFNVYLLWFFEFNVSLRGKGTTNRAEVKATFE